MTQDEWIEEMARLIKERERAESMMENWRKKLEVANAAIHYMRNPADAQETEPSPVQE